MSVVIYISKILHGNEIKRYIQNCIGHKVHEGHSIESTYKVVLGTYNLVASTRPVFLLRAVEF